jgi:hypothetical protein
MRGLKQSEFSKTLIDSGAESMVWQTTFKVVRRPSEVDSHIPLQYNHNESHLTPENDTSRSQSLFVLSYPFLTPAEASCQCNSTTTILGESWQNADAARYCDWRGKESGNWIDISSFASDTPWRQEEREEWHKILHDSNSIVRSIVIPELIGYSRIIIVPKDITRNLRARKLILEASESVRASVIYRWESFWSSIRIWEGGMWGMFSQYCPDGCSNNKYGVQQFSRTFRLVKRCWEDI